MVVSCHSHRIAHKHNRAISTWQLCLVGINCREMFLRSSPHDSSHHNFFKPIPVINQTLQLITFSRYRLHGIISKKVKTSASLNQGPFDNLKEKLLLPCIRSQHATLAPVFTQEENILQLKPQSTFIIKLTQRIESTVNQTCLLIKKKLLPGMKFFISTSSRVYSFQFQK